MSEGSTGSVQQIVEEIQGRFNRKCSRKNYYQKRTMVDLLVRMVLHSESIILSQIMMRSKPSKVLFSEAMNIFYESYLTESVYHRNRKIILWMERSLIEISVYVSRSVCAALFIFNVKKPAI